MNYQTKKRICFSTNDHPTKLLQNNNNLWCCSVILMVGDITEKRGSEQKKLKQKTKVGIGIFLFCFTENTRSTNTTMSVSQYQNTFTTDKTKTLGLKNFFPEIISGFYDDNNNNRKTKRDTEQKNHLFTTHIHTHKIFCKICGNKYA